jgi:hypothetical protein
VRSTPDRCGHADIRRMNLLDTRRMHLLAATAEFDGRPAKLLFAIRENFGGQCFLDRVTVPHAPDRRRQNGGGTPDDAGADAPASADNGSPTPAPPDPSSSYYDSAAHRWGVQGATIGAVAGGAAALAGSLALDAPSGGLNLLATPGEVAAGAYGGSAIGGGLGWAAGSIKDAYDTLVNSKSGAMRPPPGSMPIDKTPWSGDHDDIKHAIGAGGTDDVRISPTGEFGAKIRTALGQIMVPPAALPAAAAPAAGAGKTDNRQMTVIPMSDGENADLVYGIRLLIRHPQIDPALITAGLGLIPDMSHTPGKDRKTPIGTPLPGVYGETDWGYRFKVEGKRLFSKDVVELVSRLEEKAAFVHELIDTGGWIELSVQLPGYVNIGDDVRWQDLRRIAALRINFGVEVFPNFRPMHRV